MTDIAPPPPLSITCDTMCTHVDLVVDLAVDLTHIDASAILWTDVISYQHYIIPKSPTLNLAQLSLNNVHKRGLKHHNFI